ncbi:MAG: homoserine dehydrogenase [Gemmatimonadaceae bacterium]|nr:homoserine dehydrogenase [Gemmatimonadaceae bacterium]
MNVAFLGFGTVGRALHALLTTHRAALAQTHGIACTVTGVSTRRNGWWAHATGIDPHAPTGVRCDGLRDWLTVGQPDVVFEAIALEPETGQPALGYLREILAFGAHAISANKGPVVHGYAELQRIATRVGRTYRFESAVMDGAPVFSLVRECLPLAGLRAARGIFTSTATIVLEAIEEGQTLADGIARAQQLGIAEADPTYDIDGWDSAVKLCAIANVLLNGELRPHQVERTGIRELHVDAIRHAQAAGWPIRLVGDVRRDDAGVLRASVSPQRCRMGDPLAVSGTTLVTHLEADVFPGGLTVTSRDPDPTTTAYGLLADFVNACGVRTSAVDA